MSRWALRATRRSPLWSGRTTRQRSEVATNFLIDADAGPAASEAKKKEAEAAKRKAANFAKLEAASKAEAEAKKEKEEEVTKLKSANLANGHIYFSRVGGDDCKRRNRVGGDDCKRRRRIHNIHNTAKSESGHVAVTRRCDVTTSHQYDVRGPCD